MKDIDGKPVSLSTLCRTEPDWAANRIRAMRSELDAANERAEVWHRQMRESDAAQHRLQDQLAAAEKERDEARERLFDAGRGHDAANCNLGPLCPWCGVCHAEERDAARERIETLEGAILWALGENGRFPMQQEGQRRYWWRKELRLRAALSPPTHTDLMISPEEIEAMDMPDTTPEEER